MLQLSCAAVICLMLAGGEGKMFLIETKDQDLTTNLTGSAIKPLEVLSAKPANGPETKPKEGGLPSADPLKTAGTSQAEPMKPADPLKPASSYLVEPMKLKEDLMTKPVGVAGHDYDPDWMVSRDSGLPFVDPNARKPKQG